MRQIGNYDYDYNTDYSQEGLIGKIKSIFFSRILLGFIISIASLLSMYYKENAGDVFKMYICILTGFLIYFIFAVKDVRARLTDSGLSDVRLTLGILGLLSGALWFAFEHPFFIFICKTVAIVVLPVDYVYGFFIKRFSWRKVSTLKAAFIVIQALLVIAIVLFGALQLFRELSIIKL